MGRLAHNDDLLETLTRLCERNRIRCGFLQVIGAVQGAVIGYYDQKKKKYGRNIVLRQELEITSCLGNVSLKDGGIFVHAHVTLADERGKAFGGHLMPGTKVFAAEYVIRELKGTALVRKYDAVTGLYLWG